MSGPIRTAVGAAMLGLVLLSLNCSPNDEQRIRLDVDPCAEAKAVDSVETAEDVRVLFDCANLSGQLDPFEPLLEALETSTISDGETTALTLWVGLLNEEVDQRSGTSLNLSELVALLNELDAALSSEWLPQLVDLVGLVLASELPEAALDSGGDLASTFVALRDWSGDDAHDPTPDDASPADGTPAAIPTENSPAPSTPEEDTPGEATPWEETPLEATPVEDTPDAATPASMARAEKMSNVLVQDEFDRYWLELQALLCPDLPDQGQCTESVQQLYRGVLALRDEQAIEGEGSSSSELVDTLITLFSPFGADAAANHDLNQQLASGLARLGSDPFLLDALGSSFPRLYGDDASSSEIEGYESFNENLSALFGMLELLGEPDFVERTQGMVDAIPPFLDFYYEWKKGVDATTYGAIDGECSPRTGGSWEEQNPAYYGLDQLMRMIVGTDIDVDPALYPECAALLESLIDVGSGTALEMSGDSNLAVVVLEVLAQLPPQMVRDSVNFAGEHPEVLLMTNITCGTNLLLNDFEAFQAAVNTPEFWEPSMELMAKVASAEQVPAMVALLHGLYDTHALCTLQPWLSHALNDSEDTGGGDSTPVSASSLEEDPTPASGGDDSGEAQVSPLADFLPGGPYHESVTVPALRTLLRLGQRGDVLIPPLASALRYQTSPLTTLFDELGRLAWEARQTVDGGGDSPLYHLSEISDALKVDDPGYEAIATLAQGLDDTRLLAAVLETLAIEEVRLALVTPTATEDALIDVLAHFWNDGQLDLFLDVLRDTLETLETM